MFPTSAWNGVPDMMRIAALVLAVGLSAAPSAFSAGSFDGRWTVTIRTEKGTCDPAYASALKISAGTITYPEGGFDVRGRVAASGAVSVSVARGSQYASGQGRLAGNSGAGTWRGAGSVGACSGRWMAQRN
jgi:hypothetical protein